MRLGPVVESPADPIVNDAWEAEAGAERAALLRRALAIDPDCLDAHVLAAAIACEEEGRIAHLRRAVEIGDRLWTPLLDEPLMRWDQMPGPRPWLRAMLDLAVLTGDGALVARAAALDPENRLGAQSVWKDFPNAG